MKILLPDNVNPFDWEEIAEFAKAVGLNWKEPIDDILMYLNKFTYGEYIKEGERVFLKLNTYDAFPNQVFIVDYSVEPVEGNTFVKEYIVKIYK